MIPLSRAIRQHAGDPLTAALRSLNQTFPQASRESACAAALHALHTAWPRLGETVRNFPVLAQQAEDFRMIEPYRRAPNDYRREVHCSLYRFITQLHDRHNRTNAEIADLLEGARL